MKPSKDVLSAHLADEAVLLDLNSKRYFRLNESAAVIFKALEEGAGRDGAIARVLETFDVDEATATSSVDDAITELESRRLIDRGNPGTTR